MFFFIIPLDLYTTSAVRLISLNVSKIKGDTKKKRSV